MTTMIAPVATGSADPIQAVARRGWFDDPIEERRLAAVVDRAAAWPDRAVAEHFEVTGDDPAAVDRWIAQATPPGPDGPAGPAARLVGATAGDRSPSAGLRPVRLKAHACPDWVLALVGFLGAQPTAEMASGEDGLARAAAALLPSQGVSIGAEARRQLEATLVGRLHEGLQRVSLPTDRAGWFALLQEYPGLAYVVGIVCAQWVAVLTEMFDRLRADLPLLREQLWNAGVPGEITAVRGDAGDRHAGGHSVFLLEFSGGQAVVYKPKDMTHAVAFGRLTDFLGTAGLSLDLPGHTVLARDGYGWQERVDSAPCAGPDGFARFYRRLGMLVRLAQLLDGRDLWADNLIARGEYPALIDLECLLHPRPRPLPGAGRGGEARSRLDDTVVGASMVLAPWSAPQDLPIADVGCLSRVGDLRRPDGRPVLPLPPYRPFTADGPADPWAYADEVAAGYREMHGVLASVREELARPDGPLAGFRGAWVRMIRRHTWDCYKLIRASVSPAALAGGVERETALAGLLRWPLRTAGETRPDLLGVAWAEIDGLRQLDVPLFGSRTDSTSLFTADGAEIPGHMDGTAWDRLLDRVDGLDRFDLEWHCAVLAGCLDAARGGSLRTPARAAARPRRAVATRAQATAAAVTIGELLISTSIADGSGPSWIGQTWQPVTNLRTVQLLGPDLANGTLGIAIVLAELAAVTGERRFARLCRETLSAAVDLASRIPAGAVDQQVAGTVAAPAGLYGTGSVIHTLARCAERLGDSGLLAEARALVGSAVQALTIGQQVVDLPVGAAGLLANLLRLEKATRHPDSGLVAAISSVRDILVSGSSDPRAALPGPRLARVLPSGPDGTALALSRLAGQTPALVTDLTPRPVHRFDTGLRGGRLALLDSRWSRPDQAAAWAFPAPAERAAVSERPTTALLADTGEDLLAERAGDAGRADEIAAAVTELLRRHDATGGWFPDRMADDRVNLGALDGVCAVALALLQFASPDVHPLTVLR